MINFLKQLTAKPFVRKLAKYAFMIGLIYFVGYMFNLNYQFMNSNGIHGIVARKTLTSINDNATKAQIYDTIPTNYDYSSMK